MSSLCLPEWVARLVPAALVSHFSAVRGRSDQRGGWPVPEHLAEIERHLSVKKHRE